jgi:RimJ/RimL family protein N-acetyltransferase
VNCPLLEISREEFLERHLLRENNICTDIINESWAFDTRCYRTGALDFMVFSFHNDNIAVIAPYEFSDELLNQIREYFPLITRFTFFSYKKYKKLLNCLNTDIQYLYMYPINREVNIPTDNNIRLEKINDSNFEILERYCTRHQSDFFEQHPAKLTNIYKRIKKLNDDITGDVYIINSTQEEDIGFIITNSSKHYSYIAIGQMLIEEDFRKKGYGHKALTEITRDILSNGKQAYYSTVHFENIASIKCCEKVGYTLASSRIYININNKE